jgi:hypothetical protein
VAAWILIAMVGVMTISLLVALAIATVLGEIARELSELLNLEPSAHRRR